MKHLIILTIALLFDADLLFGQEFRKNDKQGIIISIGKPFFTDGSENKNHYHLSLSYQNRFSESFAFEPFYSFSRSNSYPNFFENSVELDNYLRSQKGFGIVFNSLWADISLHSLGLKVHYSFVNNDKWFFSFNFSGGVFFSKSSAFLVESWSDDADGNITAYQSSVLEGSASGLFYKPGLQVQREIFEKYFIGLDVGLYLVNETDKVQKLPLLPTHYNFSLLVGKKF